MYVFFTYGHVCEALVDERRLCIRSLSSLRSNLLLLCLLTTHDTAGSGQISSAKMKEHRKMSRLVSRSQAKQRIVKLAASR